MEEHKRNVSNNESHLSGLEKDVLDEYILELKNTEALIPLLEENNRSRYDNINGAGASLKLLKAHLNYMLLNGEFNDGQIEKLTELLK